MVASDFPGFKSSIHNQLTDSGWGYSKIFRRSLCCKKIGHIFIEYDERNYKRKRNLSCGKLDGFVYAKGNGKGVVKMIDSKERKIEFPPAKFELTSRERRTLKAFQAQYNLRFLTKFFLVVMLIYCFGVGSVSIFYAYEVFVGGRSIETIEANSSSPQDINKKVTEFMPFIQDIDFFGVGWTQILHAVLLFYIGSRSFRALYRLWHRTPRAKLALKLAKRLEELGELDLSK
jgi:hypothetical protein